MTETHASPAKNIDPRGLRTDLTPLVRRFPNLGSPYRAEWMSGTLGRPGIGPSTYWIDAILETTADVWEELRGQGEAREVPRPPLVAELAGRVPAGRLVGSAELNGHLAMGGQEGTWWISAALVEGSTTVLLTAIGD